MKEKIFINTVTKEKDFSLKLSLNEIFCYFLNDQSFFISLKGKNKVEEFIKNIKDKSIVNFSFKDGRKDLIVIKSNFTYQIEISLDFEYRGEGIVFKSQIYLKKDFDSLIRSFERHLQKIKTDNENHILNKWNEYEKTLNSF